MPATKKKAVKRKPVSTKPNTPEGLRVRNKEIRRVRVGDIIENPHNFRGHGELQRRSFRATVDEIGYYGYQDVFEHPEHPGKVMLVDGELRKDDLVQQYGEDSYIDVNVTDFDQEDAKKALATKDPLAAMADVEHQKLTELLQGLKDSEGAFGDLIGTLADYENIDLGLVEEEPLDAEPEFDRAGELQKQWDTKTGQLWEITGKSGNVHRLMCGDSTKAEDVERLLGGDIADMLFTDPPYGMGFDASWFGAKPGPGMKNPKDVKSPFSKDGAAEWDKEAFDPTPFLRLAKVVALFGANHYCHKLPVPGTWWVWDKRCSEAADELIGIPFELIWINQKCCHRIIRHNWAGITARDEPGQRHHPTQKAIAVTAEIIEYLTDAGATVLDPFIGSGTTLISAENLGRRCFGMEISEQYTAVCLQRASDIGMVSKLVTPGKKTTKSDMIE